MQRSIQVRRLTFSFVVALAPFAAAHAQVPATDAETWARALIDSKFQQNGDDDSLAASWLDLIEKEPQHPLCEITLKLLEQTSTQDAQRVQKRLLALDATRFSPAAAAVLTRMQSAIRVATTPREGLGKWKRTELFPDTLALVASLGPLGDPLDRAARQKLFAQPDFEREHTGLARRAVRWKSAERPLANPTIDPGDEVAPRGGWVMLAFEFDAERGGPGWIDFDLHGSIGPLILDVLSTQDRSWTGSLPDPSWTYSINDAAPVEVDYLHAERSLDERVPVVLRNGRNRVLLACNVDARMQFALHVLGADGRPWRGLNDKGLVEARDHRELGRKVEAQAPAQALATSESYLRALPTRGADTEMLLGTLEAFDARPASGFARLRAAVDAAPDRNGLKAWLSGAYSFAFHLPDTWKRGRARELAEAVVAADPRRADMQIALARILAPEDKEEDAIAKLVALSLETPWTADAPLELAAIYPRLDLEVPAERALLEAQARAPQSARVQQQLAEHYDSIGQPTRALVYVERGADNAVSASSLTKLGDAQSELGLSKAALASYRAAAVIGDAGERANLAKHLESLERFDEADALWAELEKRFDSYAFYALKRADIELSRGNSKAELEHLHEALRREPSNSEARVRLLAATGHEAAHDTLQRFALDVDGTLKSFDASRWNDSVVRVIDAAVAYVFEDGALEQVSHERMLVRDLQGCESEGKQQPAGAVLKIATIKASDGKEYEPTEVDGEFVMPSLQPGDSVEVITKNFRDAPEDGRVRLPGWSFAAVDQPFHLSRYVVSIPKSLALRMVLRNFEGEHKTIDEGERVVHVFETHDLPRVLLEPGSPPPEWILPSVEFVMDSNRDEIAVQIAREAALAVRVTPEIRAAAAKATEGMTSEEDKARVLHSLVTHALDKRSPLGRSSALAALLSRQGNATFLYAALLEAAGIERDIVWSRDYAPGCDPELEPPVLTPERWMRHLYLLVKPKDGTEAWPAIEGRHEATLQE